MLDDATVTPAPKDAFRHAMAWFAAHGK